MPPWQAVTAQYWQAATRRSAAWYSAPAGRGHSIRCVSARIRERPRTTFAQAFAAPAARASSCATGQAETMAVFQAPLPWRRLRNGGERERFYLYSARAARGFGDGFAAVILPAYLA